MNKAFIKARAKAIRRMRQIYSGGGTPAGFATANYTKLFDEALLTLKACGYAVRKTRKLK